jgi:hypothetical protein
MTPLLETEKLTKKKENINRNPTYLIWLDLDPNIKEKKSNSFNYLNWITKFPQNIRLIDLSR